MEKKQNFMIVNFSVPVAHFILMRKKCLPSAVKLPIHPKFVFGGRGGLVIQKDPDSQGKEGSFLAREGDSNGHQASFQTERKGTVKRGVGVGWRAGK